MIWSNRTESRRISSLRTLKRDTTAYSFLWTKATLEGYSFRKIAKIVNIYVSVVYRYLKRAVKKIEEQQDLTTI